MNKKKKIQMHLDFNNPQKGRQLYSSVGKMDAADFSVKPIKVPNKQKRNTNKELCNVTTND